MKLLAIDPGNELSAWVHFDTDTQLPLEWGKVLNGHLLDDLHTRWLTTNWLTIEMVVSYGKSVGQTTFDTCVWIGRFYEAWRQAGSGRRRPYISLIPRPDVKLHLCDSRSKVTDAVIRQRLIDLYGPGKDRAVGLKASPGPLYGMKADCWQALALAITAAETTTALAA